tara:strand:- start:3812 stop:4849 length:1038 start_codon:yes stop_codon:yes gene_type:complete
MDIDQSQIRDIFGVSSDQKKDSNEFETDVDAIAGEITFDDRVEELTDKIKDDTQIPEIKSEKKMDNKQLLEESVKSTVKGEGEGGYDDFFDKLEVEDVKTEDTDSVEEQKKDVEPEQKTTPVAKEEPKKESVAIDHVKTVKGKIYWLLAHSDKKYDAFYREKKSMLEQLLGEEEIPYHKWMEELVNSSIDMSTTQIYDLTEIQNKMIQVQKLRDRVQEIALQSNGQFFLWERTVEMFHGLLARTEYEKPVIRQEGLIYEHMRDMELYFAQLKAIHRSADQVLKTLEVAYETFSRQVTIAMQNRESVERYQKTKREEKDFDQLPVGAESKPPRKVTKTISDWNDIK